MEIREMKLEKLMEYAKLYTEVFNGEPWNDQWTEETASARIRGMMDTSTFEGRALYENEELTGMIWGQREPFFDGLYFEVQEFCVDSRKQGQGIGTMLLQKFTEELKKKDVVNLYLVTSRGPRTEGFYNKNGFETSRDMIFMSKWKL